MRKRISLSAFILAGAGLILGCAPSSPVPTLDSALLQKYQEAKLNYFNGALDKAEAGFRDIAARRGDFFQARFMLGKTLFSLGKIDEAEKVFRALAEQYPQYHEAEIWTARTELANNKVEGAMQHLQKLLAFDSSDPRLLTLYAKVSAAKKDAANALQYFKLAAQFEDEMALNHFEIARYYYQFGTKDKALLEIDKCLLLLSYESAMRESVLALKNTILQKNGDGK